VPLQVAEDFTLTLGQRHRAVSMTGKFDRTEPE
jgi:hypothetical protein